MNYEQKDRAIWRHFKRARNRLRKAEPVSFVLLATQRLFEVHANPQQLMATYQPWSLLTAIRWAMAEQGAQDQRRPRATQNDLATVLNVIHDIEGEGTLSGVGALILLMRRMSFQQFWLQGKDVHGSDIARAEQLFNVLPDDHPFQRQFKELTGMTITEFSDLGFATLTLMLKQSPPQFITEKSFDLIAPSLRPELLNKFFSFLSRTPEELPAWLANQQQGRSISDQLLLPTPFVSAPLLCLPQGYLVYHPKLLLRAICTLVYQTLKRPDSHAFGLRFGGIFETYVRRCLESARVSFEDENALKARLPRDSKCVDFLVECDGAMVLIEAKSAEMPTIGRITDDADIILGAIKHSALKAIAQALSALPALHSAATSPQNDLETFVIVVTYDELHLGSNRRFRDVYGEEFIPKLEERFGKPLSIAVEHLFFLSIQDFEFLLSCVRAGHTTIANALRHARKEDSNPATMKFDFGQHLQTLCPAGPHLPIISDGLDLVYKRIAARLPQRERANFEQRGNDQSTSAEVQKNVSEQS